MSAKHTPGPWLWQADHSGGYVVWTRQPHTGELATVYPEDINGSYPAKANAVLMASAPELLEALQGAIGALQFSRDFHNDLGNEEQAFCQDKLDAALAAIAKAEGRS